MNGALASWVPGEVLIGVIGALLLALQAMAMWRAKEMIEAIKLNTEAVTKINLRLENTPTNTAMTAMGERLTASLQAASAQQEAVIRALDRDVDRIKFRIEQGSK